jgi:uncharacterized damage-inducible protein DinB
MAARIKWPQRSFCFDFPVDVYPELIERLRGTPARVEDRLRSFPTGLLTRRDGAAWSIQENAGHLVDTEDLFTGRLDDYDAGRATLRAADMTNRKTFDVRHNDRPLEAILQDFRRERGALVARLERLAPDQFARTAQHPRLNKPMRVVDMMFFHAEHDDYHLARMTELARLFLGV